VAALAAFDAALAADTDTPIFARRLVAMQRALNEATALGMVMRRTRVPRCQAQQHSDEMQCGRCGLTWDANDPDPPRCNPVERRLTIRRAEDR
jgi:ribosomal protein S27AE